jgi:flagellar basal-body rod protein FlgB
MGVFDSVSMVALQSAMDGLAERQRAIANNVANLQTPNYHAERVQFEDALTQAVTQGSGAATATVSRSLEPTNTNGNNVNLDTETLSNVDTNLRYELATQAFSAQLSQIRAAMRTAS